MANITRRGSSYLIKVSCGYDADGKQIIKSKTWRIPKGMSDKRAEAEAQKAAVIFEEECHNGEVSSNPRLKFKDFIPTYLEMIKPHLLNRTTLCVQHKKAPMANRIKLRTGFAIQAESVLF